MAYPPGDAMNRECMSQVMHTRLVSRSITSLRDDVSSRAATAMRSPLPTSAGRSFPQHPPYRSCALMRTQ
jgi:hypothetical protein